jgi:phage gp46-like protein
MTDVALRHTDNGGEITAANGLLNLDDGLYGAVYLSLFGGNIDDSGSDGDKSRQWWGNLSELSPERKHRSETQNVLRSLPLVPASLRQIEDANKRDLAWMVPDVATADARATMPALNTVKMEIAIRVDGRTHHYSFTHYGQVEAAGDTRPLTPNGFDFGAGCACKGWWSCSPFFGGTVTTGGGGTTAEGVSDLSFDTNGDPRGADLGLGVAMPFTTTFGGETVITRASGTATYLETANPDVVDVASGDDPSFCAFGVWGGSGDNAAPIAWYGAGGEFDVPIMIQSGNLRSWRGDGSTSSGWTILEGGGSLFVTPVLWCVIRVGRTQYTFVQGELVGTITHTDLAAATMNQFINGEPLPTTPVFTGWCGGAVLQGIPNESTPVAMYWHLRRTLQNIISRYPGEGLVA